MPDKETSNPTSEITIAGIKVQCPAPYTEGHVLLANEAAALNQTYREGVRNNLTKAFKDGPEDPQAALDAYCETYTFGTRSGGGRTMDPVEREMRTIAGNKVKEALRAKGIVLKDVAKEEIGRLVQEVIDKYPQVRKTAEAIVAARQEFAEAID